MRAPRLDGWVGVVVLVMALSAGTRASALCLQNCDPHHQDNTCCAIDPEFAEACGNYLGQRAAAQAAVAAEPVNPEFSDCVSISPKCQPTTAGRCTIIAGCVSDCRTAFPPPRVPEKQIQKDAFGQLTRCGDGKLLNARGRRAAAKACRKCPAGSVTTTSTSTTISTTSTSTSTTTSTSLTTAVATSTITTTTGTTPPATLGPETFEKIDACFNNCLLRIDSLRRCYDRCHGACDGDTTAEKICQQSCRNASCLAIKARCTIDSRARNEIDPRYRRCCCNSEATNDPACDKDRAECHVSDVDAGELGPLCKVTTTVTTTSSTTVTVVTTTSTTTLFVGMSEIRDAEAALTRHRPCSERGGDVAATPSRA